MKICINFPMRATKHLTTWLGGRPFADVGEAVEDAGLDGIALTEHPYPDREWLAGGGHHALDPFVGLTHLGAATTRIRLISYLVVTGYRSPYLTAKAAGSLDLLTGGRFVLGVGAGYLRSEFEALGADFAGRGRLLDEAVATMRAVWQGVEPDGPAYGVSGHESLPAPHTPGGPPVWFGGNGRPARRRAAELGDGWMPLAQDAALAEVTGSPVLASISALGEQISELNARRADLAKEPAEVVFPPFESPLLRRSADEFCDALAGRLGDYAAAGVTWLMIEPASRTLTDFQVDIARIASLTSIATPG